MLVGNGKKIYIANLHVRRDLVLEDSVGMRSDIYIIVTYIFCVIVLICIDLITDGIIIAY